MHYYKRNIGDYHKKAGRLSMLEHGAYTLLIDACYDRERFPTEEDAIDWCWARSDEEITAVRFVLGKFFDLDGDIYVQQRIADEIDAYKGMALKNKEIAEKREEIRRTKRAGVNTERAPTVNESPPNQEPRTKNQEPEETPLIPLTGKTKKKTGLPDKFMVTPDMRSWASTDAPAVNLKTETENFCDYWRGAGGTKVDWVATWRTWMRKAQKDSQGGGRGGYKPFNKQAAVEENNARVVQEIIDRESARNGSAPNLFDTGDPITIEGEFIHAQ
jgi:uncharacterized protein YdaU (DUF1376 family)